MKLKPYKDKIKFNQVFKMIFSRTDYSSDTSICIDIDGGITLENFKKLIDYQKDRISIETKDKIVYIFGQNLLVENCSKHFATICGIINKIEIFSKEV